MPRVKLQEWRRYCPKCGDELDCVSRGLAVPDNYYRCGACRSWFAEGWSVGNFREVDAVPVEIVEKLLAGDQASTRREAPDVRSGRPSNAQ